MKKELITDLEAESLEFEELTDDEVIQPEQEKPQHYVDNEELHAAFLRYHAKKQQWIADGKEGHPPLCNVIGLAIMQIAKRRTYSRNFIAYTQHWKEEMISDAIETCVRYAHNYDPHKYNNPFAYLTQIVSFALIARIKLEKKHLYIKYKTFDNSHGFSAISDEETQDENIAAGLAETADMYRDYLTFIDDFEKTAFNSKEVTEVVELESTEVTLTDFLSE
jgi:hypothetical protein